MAYIKINHSDLERTAREIDNYISSQKRSMTKMGNEIYSLSSYWSGKDYDQIINEWKGINSKNSTTGRMVSALEGYSDFLRFCAQQYKNAQSRAVNLANMLPR